MKNYIKHIRFQQICIKVDKQHPKDISRVVFRLTQESHQQHQTKIYGDVSSQMIKWSSPIEFKYDAQRVFKFQTICEHEYGYEIEELKALYFGQIKVKPEDFFHVNQFVVYKGHNHKSGEQDMVGQQSYGEKKARIKCGKLSVVVKIVDREVGLKVDKEKQVENKDRIKVDLIGRLIVNRVRLLINPLYIPDYENRNFSSSNGKGVRYKFQVKIDAKYMYGKFVDKDSYVWQFDRKTSTAELIAKSDKYIRMRLIEVIGQEEDGIVVLEGKLPVAKLLKNKRFLTQSVGLYEIRRGIKIGMIEIDMRLVEKKEILDLMYSPKKLEEIKMEEVGYGGGNGERNGKADEGNVSLPSYRSLGKMPRLAYEKKEPLQLGKRPSLNLSTNMNLRQNSKQQPTLPSSLEQPESMSPSRLKQSHSSAINPEIKQKYDIYFRNRYQNIKFAQSRRPNYSPPKTPYVSYLGPDSLTGFLSPKNTQANKKKQNYFSSTNKVDFTKNYKNNPGVGKYNLPSIWEKS